MACKETQETLTSLQLLADCSLQYNAEGGPQSIPLWEGALKEKVIALIPDAPDIPEHPELQLLSDCSLVHGASSVPLWPALEAKIVPLLPAPTAASTFDYSSAGHSVTHNGVPHQLNCGALGFDQATCSITYTDEKGQFNSIPLPQDQVLYSPLGCTVTVLPAKGGTPVVFPVGVAAADVGLVMVGKNLEFTYKDKKCVVALPNSVIGCQYDPGTNTLRMLFCDGTTDEKQLVKASLTMTALNDGTQIGTFLDGCGGQTQFNITPAMIDTDAPPTLVGSVLTFVYGGDGNPATTSIDICDIVANNCNATITSIDPVTGGFSFMDNAGATFTVPGHVPPELVGSGDITVTSTIGSDGQVIYEVAYTHTPSGPQPVVLGADNITVTPSMGAGGEIIYTVSTPDDCCHYNLQSTTDLVEGGVTAILGAPTLKGTGDTATQKHPNGLSAWTCVAGNWVLDWVCIFPEPTQLLDPTKETFRGGDTLPVQSTAVTVCVLNNAGEVEEVQVAANGPLPTDMLGWVQVDETDGTTAYIAPKLDSSIPTLVTSDDDTVDVVESVDPVTGGRVFDLSVPAATPVSVVAGTANVSVAETSERVFEVSVVVDKDEIVDAFTAQPCPDASPRILSDDCNSYDFVELSPCASFGSSERPAETLQAIDGTDVSGQTSVEVTNNNCLHRALKCVEVCAGADLLVQAGHKATITPVVDGVPQSKLSQSCDNQGGVLDANDTMTFSFSYTSPTQAEPEEMCDAVVSFTLSVETDQSNAAVSASNSVATLRDGTTVNVKLIPVC